MLIFLWDKSGRTKETPFRAKIGLKHLKKRTRNGTLLSNLISK